MQRADEDEKHTGAFTAPVYLSIAGFLCREYKKKGGNENGGYAGEVVLL